MLAKQLSAFSNEVLSQAECHKLKDRSYANVRMLCLFIHELGNGNSHLIKATGLSRGVLGLFIYHQAYRKRPAFQVGLFKELRRLEPGWSWPARDLLPADINSIVMHLVESDLVDAIKKSLVSEVLIRQSAIEVFGVEKKRAEMILRAEIETGVRSVFEENRVTVRRGLKAGRERTAAQPLETKMCCIHPDRPAVLSSKVVDEEKICKMCSLRAAGGFRTGKLSKDADDRETISYLREYAITKGELTPESIS